jgi:hypothetical protein
VVSRTMTTPLRLAVSTHSPPLSLRELKRAAARGVPAGPGGYQSWPGGGG